MSHLLSIKSYPGIDKAPHIRVFTTIKSTKTGVLIGIKQKGINASNATFKIFSGRKNSDATELPQTVFGGRTPSGKYFITDDGKHTNTPTFIKSKIIKHNVLSYPDLARKKQYWLKLYLDDREIPGTRDFQINDVINIKGVKRDGFRAHYGLESLGCITFSDIKEYNNFINIIASVTPFFVHRKTGAVTDKKVEGSFKAFGVLIVD